MNKTNSIHLVQHLDSAQIEMPAISNKKKSSHSSCTQTLDWHHSRIETQGSENTIWWQWLYFKRLTKMLFAANKPTWRWKKQTPRTRFTLIGGGRTNCACECFKITVVACFIDHECMNDKRPRVRCKSLICCFGHAMLRQQPNWTTFVLFRSVYLICAYEIQCTWLTEEELHWNDGIAW